MSISTESMVHELKPNVNIKASIGDRVNAILISSLLMFGFLFATLFTIWWFQPAFESHTIVGPTDPIEPLRSDTQVKDTKLSIVEFDNSESATFEKSVAMTGVSIASVSQVDGMAGDGDATIHGIGWEKRQVAPAGAAVQNWRVTHEANDLESYLRKLDFFAIEIGAVHQLDDRVWRIAQLSTQKVVSESSRSAESGRQYFVNQKKRLLQWDRQTIAQAGLDLENVIPVHFYPSDLTAKMQQLIELRFEGRSNDLKEVTFKIVGVAGGFRFEIEDVKFDN